MTPIGKVFDVMLQRGKITRPPGDNPAEVSLVVRREADDQVMSLVALVAEPDAERKSVSLTLSDAVLAIPEGSVVVLVKGWKG